MIDLKQIIKDPGLVRAQLERRGVRDLEQIIQEIKKKDDERKSLIQETEKLKNQRNEASQEIAKIKKAKGDASKIVEEMRQVSQKIKEMDEPLAEVEAGIRSILLSLPNLPLDSVPEGLSEKENRMEREWGEKPQFNFSPQSHFEMGEKQGWLDFKKAGEVTGARFVYLRGVIAKLERALIQYMLATHSKSGYEEIVPPFIVNSDSYVGTGQFPKFKEDVFKLEDWDYYLISTAEVPLTNYFRNEILDNAQLPIKFVGYTPCFRSEAGSYGKDTKGLKRQHQFNKIELVKFVQPEASEAELELLVKDAESVLQNLKLPYRVMTLCAGDTGFSAAKTYDLEVWSPYAEAYMEISSCSTFTDFQARRANIRYRDPATKKPRFVHTLNGSGLAVGRTVIAIMENYQNSDGSFDIPEVLRPYI